MNCRRVVNLISAYLDGELSGVEMFEIRAHMAECPECAGEFESLRTIKRACARLRAMAPREGFQAQILATLDEVRVPPFQRFINRLVNAGHRKLSPVATALAASAVALALLSAGGIQGVRPEATVEAAIAAPFGAPIQTATYLPELPGGKIRISRTEPLIVPRETSSLNETPFQMVVMYK